MREQVANLVGTAFHRLHQYAGQLMVHLSGNPAHGAGDHWFVLPQRLGHGEAESLTQGFLDDDGRGALQRIDLQRAPGR